MVGHGAGDAGAAHGESRGLPPPLCHHSWPLQGVLQAAQHTQRGSVPLGLHTQPCPQMIHWQKENP